MIELKIEKNTISKIEVSGALDDILAELTISMGSILKALSEQGDKIPREKILFDINKNILIFWEALEAENAKESEHNFVENLLNDLTESLEKRKNNNKKNI